MREEILHYLSDQALSSRTRQIHQRYLLGLMQFADLSRSSFDSTSVVLGYLGTLAPHAKKRAWSVLSKFFAWRILTGRALVSPMAPIPRPRALTRPRQGVSQADLCALLDQIDKDVGSRDPIHFFGALRLKAFVHLVLYYGLRTGEIISLQLKDYDARGKLLLVTRKTGRSINISLHPEICDMLDDWLRLRARRSVPRSPWLFVTWRGHKLSNWTVIVQFDKLAARAGVMLPSQGLHQLRHTMAGIMLRRGDNLQEIASYLGHFSLSSTDFYLRTHFGKKTQAGRDLVNSIRAARPSSSNPVISLVDPNKVKS